MWLGVDYYPEQWDYDLLDQDLDTIVELGCNVIRIAEFSWHLMEKTEGNFDFSFFDRVIEHAKARGLKVIMGTPTATIPAWLAKKYPSVLSEFEGGKKRTFGGRHVYCFSSPVLYEYSEKIIRNLVEHYKDEEAVVAWQLDNEIGHEGADVCFCQQCQTGFQKFLEQKWGGDIDLLNDTYGTTFWSQEYNSFDEIPTPMETITTHNPALRLDWERFRSKIAVDFLDWQVELIREIAPEAHIIHDFEGGGLTKHIDFSKVAKSIDTVAYNNYPVWGGQREPLEPHQVGFALDYIRGLKNQNFWITEAIMGAQGHDVTGYSPRPNQAKTWSYQGFAHGCDSMMYFRYRGATKGAEQFCYGVLDADNVKRRKFYEVQSCFKEMMDNREAMETPMKSDVAIVYDYDSVAAFRIQKQSFLLDPPAEMEKLYKAFYDVNVPCDVIPEDAPIDGYKVVMLSQMIIGKPEMEAKIKEFVKAGGTAVLTYRSFVKDEHNNLTFGELVPVGFADFCGITMVETESLQEGQNFPIAGEGVMTGQSGIGGIYREMLEVTDAEVLYRYGDMFYDGFAAVTRKQQGEGTIYYIGCGVDEATLNNIMDGIMADKAIESEPSEPGVEIAYRGCGDNRVRMVMNFNGHEVRDGENVLAPYESRIEKL